MPESKIMQKLGTITHKDLKIRNRQTGTGVPIVTQVAEEPLKVDFYYDRAVYINTKYSGQIFSLKFQ